MFPITSQEGTVQTLTNAERRQILADEYRKALANITPNMGTRYSGQQIAAARGIARRRALAIIDARTA
jgi:hypothetical protein